MAQLVLHRHQRHHDWRAGADCFCRREGVRHHAADGRAVGDLHRAGGVVDPRRHGHPPDPRRAVRGEALGFGECLGFELAELLAYAHCWREGRRLITCCARDWVASSWSSDPQCESYNK